ncbi:MAG TPA: hypothetical protein VK611_17030 [Acidimicrobiales bacterium]|nr:hypothetical protein [Acidimicrobiales bacterium]
MSAPDELILADLRAAIETGDPEAIAHAINQGAYEAAVAEGHPDGAEGFTKTVLRAGRANGPRLLQSWFINGRLTSDDLHKVLADVWTGAEWPAQSLGVATWVHLFRMAGIVSDDGGPPPTEPLTAYRGATWGRRRGMSWTTDRERARWFADRFAVLGPAFVFTAEVPPGAVLALIGEKYRSEGEVVVDPALLPPIRRP